MATNTSPYCPLCSSVNAINGFGMNAKSIKTTIQFLARHEPIYALRSVRDTRLRLMGATTPAFVCPVLKNQWGMIAKHVAGLSISPICS